MQRFKQPNMDLHPDGEWIRYDDHVEAMKRIAGDGAPECDTCNGFVHVHDAIGEYRGECPHCATSASAQQAEPVAWLFDNEEDGKHWYDTPQPMGRPVYAAPAPSASPAALTDVDAVMTKIQEFASTWAVVGGRFDDGTAMECAEECKAEIRALLMSATPPAAE